MAELLTVRDILIAYLRANGYDGLAGEDCGCGVDDLAPCEGYPMGCVPAHEVPCPGEDGEDSEGRCGECGGCGEKHYVPGPRPKEGR